MLPFIIIMIMVIIIIIIMIIIIINDGKMPDGLTLVSWCAGKALTWDVTAVSTFADSYVVSAAQEAGAPAQLATSRTNSKCSLLSHSYNFQQIAVETSGVINCSAIDYLTTLGRRISSSN